MDTIIPVIDLLRNEVVHAVAGDREHYRPIRSQLAEGSAPSTFANAFRRLGFRSIYVADLDAIMGVGDNDESVDQIIESGLAVWLDAGITSDKAAEALFVRGIHKVIIGLEVIESQEQIAKTLSVIDSDRMVISLDMKHGQIITRERSWRRAAPFTVAASLIELGVEEMILLDVGRVGTGNGTGTEELCRQIRSSYPEVPICVGGGVADHSDVDRLLDCGASRVLVSTALHDRRIVIS